MKKSFCALICVAFTGFAYVACLQSCKCGSGSEETGCGPIEEFAKSDTYTIVKGEAPEGGYKIYLDASGSMPGYFTDGLTDYINIVSGLQGGNENTKVYFWGDATREITNLNSTITNGNYKAKASLFQDIFKVMAQDAKTEKALTFLVTDGIVSNSSSVTSKRTGYTKADLPLLPGKIQTALGDSLAVGIFRLEIPFNGTYWNIDNKQKSLKDVKRPIFVFAIGYPSAVSDLKNSLSKKEMENFTNLHPQQLYMGILKENKNCNFFRDVEGNFVTNEDNTGTELAAGSESFEIAVDIPDWISELGVNPEDGIISIANVDGDKLKVRKSYRNGTLTVSTKDDCEIDLGQYNVNFFIAYRPSTKWQKYACDDDRAISSDTLCDRTFGLSEILKGFELATKQPDTLFNSSFDFVKQ
jgi:hypothetical protein